MLRSLGMKWSLSTYPLLKTSVDWWQLNKDKMCLLWNTCCGSITVDPTIEIYCGTHTANCTT